MKISNNLIYIALVMMGILVVGVSYGLGSDQTSQNVSVINTPTVNLANGTGVKINGNVGVDGSITVKNTNSNPIPVVDINNPGLNPFGFQGNATFDNGASIETISFQVPVGKRLVIEQVAAEATALNPDPNQKLTVFIYTITGGVSTFYVFSGSPIASGSLFIAGTQMRSYADSGTTVNIEIQRDITIGGAEVTVSASGYLVESS